LNKQFSIEGSHRGPEWSGLSGSLSKIFAEGVVSQLIPFPQSASDETERKRDLYAWCDRLLERLGLTRKVAEANSVDDLRKIVFDVDSFEVGLAVRDALHPTSGPKADIFCGLHMGMVKRVIKARFNDLKKQREMELTGCRTRGSDWMDDLKFDACGRVRPLLTNLILFLRHHPKWQGVLAFDEFNVKVVIRNRPPWGVEPVTVPWTDHHESLTRSWFQQEDIAPGQGDVARAVQAAARHNPVHPVRDYFDGLKWDGTARLDGWLVTYLHADDTPYTRAIGPRFLISAVARIYHPGCKVDHMLVLEGPQGKQKSEALRALVVNDTWFTDHLSHVSSKDAMLEIAGVLLVEIAELDALTKATSSAVKAYLTKRADRFRPPYGKHVVQVPRQCVFAGTINPPAGGYLQDPTGARRIWPVRSHGTIDREGIERDRDMLWAEAIERYKARAPWWLETPEIEALATAEQKARFKTDVWKEPIEKWLGERIDVSLAEVLEQALGIPPRAQTHSAEIRVASILTDLGFTKRRPSQAGDKPGRSYRYQREKI
jgi:predicted P-loop ATPase